MSEKLRGRCCATKRKTVSVQSQQYAEDVFLLLKNSRSCSLFSIMGLAISARSPPFSWFALPIFSSFFTYADASVARHISLNFLPCWFSVCAKPRHCSFNCLFKVIKPKTQKCVIVGPNKRSDGGILYRCKQLCMLIFRLVSPSLIERKYSYCISKTVVMNLKI